MHSSKFMMYLSSSIAWRSDDLNVSISCGILNFVFSGISLLALIDLSFIPCFLYILLMYDGDILSGLNWRLNLIALSFSVSGAYLASVSYENRKSKCFYVNLRFLPGCEKLRDTFDYVYFFRNFSQLIDMPISLPSMVTI